MALSRVELLVKLNELLYDRGLDHSSFSVIQDKMNGFLEGNITSEEITIWINSESPDVTNYNLWMDDIRNKPIYSTMRKYIKDELITDEEIAKMTGSILTQLLIRKELHDEFDLKIMDASQLLDIMYGYVDKGDIDKESLSKWILNHTDLKGVGAYE